MDCDAPCETGVLVLVGRSAARRVRARGLQALCPQPCRPGAPTRRAKREISGFNGFLSARLSGFTLIELILVMALLTVAVSVTAPALSNFFRGRTLDSEARRLLAMTRGGQNRAVSEGVPIDLWLDTSSGRIGLEAEPSYEKEDPKAQEFELDSGLTLEVVKQPTVLSSIMPLNPNQPISIASVPRVNLTHANLPTIRFLPDGTLSETSPEKVKLSGRDGTALWLVQAKNKLSYEIRSTDE